MRHYDLQAKDLADLCGVQRTAITHLLNGRNRPSVGFLSQLSDAYPELNTRWLLHGRGNMFTNVTSTDVTPEDFVLDLPAEPEQTADVQPSMKFTSDERVVESIVTDVTNVVPDDNVETKPSSIGDDAQAPKAIRQVIIFYTDGTFKAYNPS